MGPHTPQSQGQEISMAAAAAEGWLETLEIKTINSPKSRSPKNHRTENTLSDPFVCFDRDLVHFKLLYIQIVKELHI